jgi:GNAT superfamily N-acetyltransferase
MGIRRAHPADAAVLSAIAEAAKAGHDYPAAWLAAWAPQLTFTPEDLERLDAYVIEQDVIGGFYVTVPGDPRWTLDHLWVRPDRARRGLGRRLVGHALARAHAAGATGLRIEADPHAVPFYEQLGARSAGWVAAPAPGVIERRLPILELDAIASRARDGP